MGRILACLRIQIVVKVAYGVRMTIIICFRNPLDEPNKSHRFAMTMRNFRLPDSSGYVRTELFIYFLFYGVRSFLFYFAISTHLNEPPSPSIRRATVERDGRAAVGPAGTVVVRSE